MNILPLNLMLLFVWWFVFRGRLSKGKRGSDWYLGIVFIQMMLMTLFAPIFSDAAQYAFHARLNWYSDFGIGWKIFSQVIWGIWPDAKSLVFFTSLIFELAFVHFCRRYSNNYALSYFFMVTLGFFGMSLFILRQTVALAIVLLAYDAVEERKLPKFLLLILIACSFHVTAILFVALYPISNLRRKGAFHLGCILAGITLLLCSTPLSNFMTSHYHSEYVLTGFSGENLLLLMILLVIIYELRGDNCDRLGIGHALELAPVFQVLALRFSTFTRATRYFQIATTVAIPNLIESFHDKRLRFLATFAVVVFFSFFYIVVQDWAVDGFFDSFVFNGLVMN